MKEMVSIDCVGLQEKTWYLPQHIRTCTLNRKAFGLKFYSNGLVFCACITDKYFDECQRL